MAWLNVALAFAAAWLMTALASAQSNLEFAELVDAIKGFPSSQDCRVDIDVRRAWPFSWTPAHFTIRITDGERSIETSASRSVRSTRIRRGSGSYEHDIPWDAEAPADRIMPTFLAIEIDRYGAARWVEAGQCEPMTREAYFSPGPACRERDPTVLRCTL